MSGGGSRMIREWAREQGMQVADRGLIPRHIIDAYKKAHGIPSENLDEPRLMQFPVMPPKPRVTFGGDCWVIDTGHADVLVDTWPEAIAHAARICADYRARVIEWAQR